MAIPMPDSLRKEEVGTLKLVSAEPLKYTYLVNLNKNSTYDVRLPELRYTMKNVFDMSSTALNIRLTSYLQELMDKGQAITLPSSIYANSKDKVWLAVDFSNKIRDLTNK